MRLLHQKTVDNSVDKLKNPLSANNLNILLCKFKKPEFYVSSMHKNKDDFRISVSHSAKCEISDSGLPAIGFSGFKRSGVEKLSEKNGGKNQYATYDFADGKISRSADF